MTDTVNEVEEYEVVQTYEGDETTIYYDSDGDQHVVVKDYDNE